MKLLIVLVSLFGEIFLSKLMSKYLTAGWTSHIFNLLRCSVDYTSAI